MRQGFAIPVDIAKRVVSQIIQHRRADPGLLGCNLIPPDLQEVLELQKGSMFGGVVISKVIRGTPAFEVGLQDSVLIKDDEHGGGLLEPRDLIVAVDGIRVGNSDEVFGITSSKLPGETILLTVSRVARIGDFNRWEEIIPVKLATFDELLESDAFREWYKTLG